MNLRVSLFKKHLFRCTVKPVRLVSYFSDEMPRKMNNIIFYCLSVNYLRMRRVGAQVSRTTTMFANNKVHFVSLNLEKRMVIPEALLPFD